jgi:hypothetical protein
MGVFSFLDLLYTTDALKLHIFSSTALHTAFYSLVPHGSCSRSLQGPEFYKLFV